MLDKTNNLFTCMACGDRSELRFPVCRHVRAWVKKEIADAYQKGYINGNNAAVQQLRANTAGENEPQYIEPTPSSR